MVFSLFWFLNFTNQKDALKYKRINLWQNTMWLKTTFTDVGNLYKNFLHWNLSKVSIFIFSLLIALAITLPVVLVSLMICWILWVDWVGYMMTFFAGTLNAAAIYTADFFIFMFFVIIWVITFFLSMTYGKIMYFDLNLKYLENKKSDLVKTKFFNPKLFGKFYAISLRVFWYLLIPVAIFIVGMIVTIIVNGWVNTTWVSLDNGNTTLALWTFIFAGIWIILFLYLSYRLYFSYVGLVDEQKYPEIQSAKTYVKNSFEITKGWKKIMKLLGTLLLFAIIIAPYTFITQAIENTYNDVNNVAAFQQMWEEEKLAIMQANPYFSGVLNKYKDISIDDLQRNISVYNYLLIFMSVIGFLLITWVVEMVMVSHYKQISREAKTKKISETKKEL